MKTRVYNVHGTHPPKSAGNDKTYASHAHLYVIAHDLPQAVAAVQARYPELVIELFHVQPVEVCRG